MTSNEYWKITDTLKLIKIAKRNSSKETITKNYINHLSTNVNLMREAQSFAEREMTKKIDIWWNKITIERVPTNSFEKDKKQHCFVLDYKDLEKLKGSLVSPKEVSEQ